MARPPEEFYFEDPPTEGVDLGVWGDEIIEETAPALADPQLRLLLGRRVLDLLDRLASAPQREKYFERVSRMQIDPIEVPDADEGWYRDTKTGRWVVYEDQFDPPYWVRAIPHPPGAFTIGEMVEVEALLWGAGEALAQAADQGFLNQSQREAAIGVVEAADNLQMRITIKKWHPDQATRDRAKRDALETLAGRNGPKGPDLTVVRKLKNKLLK